MPQAWGQQPGPMPQAWGQQGASSGPVSGPTAAPWSHPGNPNPTSGPVPQPWNQQPGPGGAGSVAGPPSGPVPQAWGQQGASGSQPQQGGQWQPGEAAQPYPTPGPNHSAHNPASGSQPQQGGQWQPSYGGFGAFAPEKPRRSTKPLLIGLAVVVLLGAGGAGAWLLGAFQGDTLDQTAVQDGVLKILREDFGEGDVRDAQCPEDQPVRTGTTFECTVTVAGQPKKVTVRVLNDQAQYEVGMPR